MSVQIFYGQRAMNALISHLEGVKGAVYEQATEVRGKAEAKLARHRDTGRAKVTLTRGQVDSFVNLDDPAALSIEFGHAQEIEWQENGDSSIEVRWVDGLHIITGAAGLLD